MRYNEWVEWRDSSAATRYQMWPASARAPVDWFRTGYTGYQDTRQAEVCRSQFWVPAVTHRVDHQAETHTVDHPAETHVVTHPEESHVVTHPAETHIVSHPEVNHEEQVVDVAEHSVPGEHHDAIAEVSHLEYQWAATSPGDAMGADRGVARRRRLRGDGHPGRHHAGRAGRRGLRDPAGPGAGDGGAGDGGTGNGPAKAPAAAPAASAASAVPALAHTGADGTAELLALGLVLVFAGAGVQRVVRQRA